MAYNIAVDEEVKRAFNITEVVRHVPSGQKYVFIVMVGGQQAVLKIMRGEVSRLPREMTVYNEFKDHPGLAPLIKTELINKRHVLLEEYIDGHSLDKIIPFYQNDEYKVKSLIVSIIKILSPIWRRTIVHRDIKPDNIIIRPDGTPVILDFGIAKDFLAGSVTATGFQPLTPLYAAPEQYRGDKTSISFKTDAFSIGVVAYQLLYNQLPFGDTEDAIRLRFQNTNQPLVLPQNCPIHDFLTASLSFSPSERPRTPEKLLSLIS